MTRGGRGAANARGSLRLRALAMLVFFPSAAATQSAEPAAAPFAPGEELTFEVRSSRFGGLGHASMVVQGMDTVRGREVYRLAFDLRAHVAFFDIEDRTRSWIDPQMLASLRFRKHERSPLASRDEDVEIDPAMQAWQAADGSRGRSPSARPLDELSFLYFLRTLPLAADQTYSLQRHYDAARNPVTVRVAGREQVTVPAGTFSTILVEMRVKDSRRFGGDGVLRLHLSDDERRIFVRIESSMPLAGRIVLELAAERHAELARP